MKGVYLDTSAIIKRYITEEQSDRVLEIYDQCYSGKLTLGYSVWNIGEVAVVLDKREKRGDIGNGKAIFLGFLRETLTLLTVRCVKIVPIEPVLPRAVEYVFKYRIYFADALQIASAKNFDAF